MCLHAPSRSGEHDRVLHNSGYFQHSAHPFLALLIIHKWPEHVTCVAHQNVGEEKWAALPEHCTQAGRCWWCVRLDYAALDFDSAY